MDPDIFKKTYRKAIMLCHPDKIRSTDDPDRVFIASRCFAALTDAGNQFKVNYIHLIKNIIERRRSVVK